MVGREVYIVDLIVCLKTTKYKLWSFFGQLLQTSTKFCSQSDAFAMVGRVRQVPFFCFTSKALPLLIHVSAVDFQTFQPLLA